jgi:hypothetical protein
MVQTVRQIASGTMVVRENREEEGSYFGWPSVEQMRDFRRQGGRLS